MNYSARFLHYFSQTDHAGRIEREGAITIRNESINPFDQFCLYVVIEQDCIKEVAFESSSTPVLIAAGEYISRWLENKSLQEAIGLQKEQILQELDLDRRHVYAADLVQRLVLRLDSKGCAGEIRTTGNVV